MSLVSGEKRTSLMSCWCPVILVTGFFSSSGCHRYKVKSSEPDTSLSAPAPYEIDIRRYLKSSFFSLLNISFFKGRNLKYLHGVSNTLSAQTKTLVFSQKMQYSNYKLNLNLECIKIKYFLLQFTTVQLSSILQSLYP